MKLLFCMLATSFLILSCDSATEDKILPEATSSSTSSSSSSSTSSSSSSSTSSSSSSSTSSSSSSSTSSSSSSSASSSSSSSTSSSSSSSTSSSSSSSASSGSSGSTSSSSSSSTSSSSSSSTSSSSTSSSSSSSGGEYNWVHCANENEDCSFDGLKQVRYGAQGAYVIDEFEDVVRCINASFGNDPIRNVVKTCEVRELVQAGGSSSTSSSSTSSSSTSSSSTSSSSTSSSSTSSSSSGSVSEGEKGIFVAQGHLGRTTISCDGGLTWVHDQSDSSERCGDDVGCDHHTLSGRGVAFSNGSIITVWGWGQPGSIRQSVDGVTWDIVHQSSNSYYTRAVSVDDVVLVGGISPLRSLNNGISWEQAPGTGFFVTTRRLSYLGGKVDKFILTTGSKSDARVFLIDRESVVNGHSEEDWLEVEDLPDACNGSAYIGGAVLGGNDDIIVIGANKSGAICYSKNLGQSFSAVQLSEGLISLPLWFDGKFWAWSNNNLFTSQDGENWSVTELVKEAGMVLSAIGYGDGNFVSVHQSYGKYYEDQKFVRSTDGITWTYLDDEAYIGSHPIFSIDYGQVKESELDCEF